MMVNGKERDTSLDMARFFAVVLMLLGHCISNGNGMVYRDANMHMNNLIYVYIYSFHMPLFAILSGYLMGRSIKSKTFCNAVYSKVLGLIIPIISWSALYGGLGSIKAFFFYQDFTLKRIYDIVFSLAMGVVNAHENVWFLWSMLLASLICIFVHFYLKDNLIAYIVILLSTGLINQRILQLWASMLPFFTVAYLYSIYSEKCSVIKKILNHKYSVIYFFVIHIAFLILWKIEYYPYLSGNIINFFYEGKLILNIYINFVRFLCGISGALFYVILFKKISPYLKWNKVQSIIISTSKYSMGYYAFSVYYLNQYLRNLEFPEPNVLRNLLQTILIYVACYLFIYTVEKFALLRKCLLGGR